MVGRHLFGKASWQVLVLGSVFGFIKDQYMLPSLQTFAEIASHLEESFFFSSWKIYSNMFWQIRDSHPMPPIFSESNLLNVAGDFEGSLRRCSIFTVGTLGVRIFFGKNWGFVVLRLFFLHAVFLFLSFFGGKLKEISEIEISFGKKIRSESYRDFSCKKCRKTLQGCPVKQGRKNQVFQSWLSGESC